MLAGAVSDPRGLRDASKARLTDVLEDVRVRSLKCLYDFGTAGGALSAVGAGKEVVLASDYRALQLPDKLATDHERSL